MTATYNPAHIAAYYDAYADKEWDRLVSTPADAVSFHIHKHYLERFVNPGDRVLEAGAGPGRFTIELAKLGAAVTVGDISEVQLKLNEQRVIEADCEAAVEARAQFDITDLRQFEAAVFDAVVCYGGPLSYVMDRGEEALSELLRVLRPGGCLLLSVMSLLGATRAFFEGISSLESYPDIVDEVNAEGMLSGEVNKGHAMKLYRAAELKGLLERSGSSVEVLSASNFISVGRDELMREQMTTPESWERVLSWELGFCAEPGAVDCGTHIIAVARKASA